MTNTLTRIKTAPLRALGKYDSEHVANQYTLELIKEKDQSDIDNEEMVSVAIYDPTDPDVEDSQIDALNEATGNTLPYFR